MAVARDHHHSDTRRARRRQAALLALAVAALLAAALTGGTLGREPQARSAPAPVLAPKRAGRHRRHPRGGRTVEPSVVTIAHD